MAIFKYKAADLNGKKKAGVLTATSREEAAGVLQRKGLSPRKIEEVSPEKAGQKSFFSSSSHLFQKKVSAIDLAIFFRQLAISITAGVSLKEALDNISKEMDSSPLRTALRKAAEDLDTGLRLAEAMKRNNKDHVFPPISIGLARVAEETGTMGDTLNSLADYLEKSNKIKGEITGKLAYPAFMIVAFIGIMLFATFVLFPKFAENFASLGSELPALTRNVFAANDIALALSPYFFAVLILAGIGLAVLRRSTEGRRKVDAALLKIPLLGELFYKIQTARFCQTLAITAKGGVPLLDGLHISSGVLNNSSIKHHLENIREGVTNGRSLGASIRSTGAFTGLVVRMIEVGEESGRLPLVLEKVSEIYNLEVSQTISKVTSLIEPVIIVIFGIFVTIMVLALYMPIFSMSSGM